MATTQKRLNVRLSDEVEALLTEFCTRTRRSRTQAANLLLESILKTWHKGDGRKRIFEPPFPLTDDQEGPTS